ncbi:uncharacterized protein LOC133241618 isoform X2 [Bos javanicus]|uniref:uncharacterized protein LOC133241618 isoform X2 n=1 Tax=Bos javanicus TaxID=9906 RepID=UPI002AA7D4AE|nr:uncharacterized protein LOC133241618 isoform X2 [Bos javanicus]
MPSKAHRPGHAVSDLREPHQTPNRERLWIFTGVTEPWGPLADSAHSAIKEPRAPSGVPSAPTAGAPVLRKHLPEQAEKARVCRAQRPLLGRRVRQAGRVHPEGRALLMGKWPGAVPGAFQKWLQSPHCSAVSRPALNPLDHKNAPWTVAKETGEEEILLRARRLSHDTEYGPLCCPAGPCFWCVLYVRVCIC